MKTYCTLSLLLFASFARGFVLPTGSSKMAGHSLCSTSQSQSQSHSPTETVRIPVGHKERYVRSGNVTDAPIPLAQLEQECKNLREQLRHDLIQLKSKQIRVAKEEDLLLKRAMEAVESDRSFLEQDKKVAANEKEKVRKAVQQAHTMQQLAAEKWSRNKQSWLDSGGRDLRALFALEEASTEWKRSQEAVLVSEEAKRQAKIRELRAAGILEFLDKQAAALQEIARHPEKEQQWIDKELSFQNHGSLLKVAALEWETEQLWGQLRQDLLELKQLQMQVKKEEDSLVDKESEIIAVQTQEEKKQVQNYKAAMKRAYEEVRQAVVRKEQAYKGTLAAIKVGDKDPTTLWKLVESARYLDNSNQAENAAKEVLTRIAAKEPQAEDLLALLERTGSFLKELRLPGHEKALEKWVQNELAGHESMLEVVKKELLHSSDA